MTRTWAVVLAVAAGALSAGCKSLETPRQMRGDERPDRPGLPIAEQERNGRARYGLHSDDYRVGPNTYNSRVTPTGVGR